ncbi:universal stress protein [Antrihabitans sp. YC2-6]|uniref:universal stress protein n=1 Tax=Antrihabitans sp. YC2-6 TaxID=2799498 RepID=UPI0018F557A1|nr:universal stress protein [Antrihabitans sp. YC2-6]MBJ8344043.1 universal stress protein [Antrihabitans sp. YC2-6]
MRVVLALISPTRDALTRRNNSNALFALQADRKEEFMESYARVIAGTDGSPDASAAVRLGGRIAGKLGVPFEVIVAYDGDNGRDRSWAEATAAAAETLAKTSGATETSAKAVAGEADEILLAAAEVQPEALISVGSAGLSKGASRIFGSTSNKLAHHSLADVLFVRDPLPTAWNFVALATDGSDTSVKAAQRGLILARALDSRPRLITSAKNQEEGNKILADVSTKISANIGVDIEQEVLEDSGAGGALISKAWKFEIVVIGNRGMSGASRLLGSVANKVTHGIETNLLLVNTTRG